MVSSPDELRILYINKMNRMIFALSILLGAIRVQDCDAYRILFIGPVGTRSHKNYFSSIIDGLVMNNHHVTFITPFPSASVKANVKEVVVPEGDFSKFNLNLFDEKFSVSAATVDKYYSMCDETVQKPQVQSLLEEKFDVALLSAICSECYFSLIHKFQIPFISVLPLDLLAETGSSVGNPIFSSFQAHPFLDFDHPFTFWQRINSVLWDTMSLLYMLNIYQDVEQRCRASGICPEDMPSIYDMTRKVSMIFINSIPVLQKPVRPLVPAVLPIGGIHCQPPKQLPQDLQEWVEGSGEDGIIYFSLGSIVKPSTLPEKNRLMFIKVFGSLKQRVLWKWDKESMPDLPPNVLLRKWVPQQDILGHEKLRLFISQSGLFSTQESLYHGKPVLSLPVYADQLSNARSVERQGWGKVIIWEEMTEEMLFDKINSIINNEEMKERVQEKSHLMKDQPLSTKSLMVYWTEYVVRHGGAAHLRCPLVDLPWYKVYNLDVWLTLVAVTVILLWLIVRLFLAIISCLCRRVKRKLD
ncbi:UDP-glycosyltransferase UGT5-like isoform X2 [Palaemon carinicauda]|uniref:UDP-glycosyltransferase UGT5-like isoform X2 n=1 Tax=Palaemon carinicauda TaxID=392227 RepID=UPI0035B696A9